MNQRIIGILAVLVILGSLATLLYRYRPLPRDSKGWEPLGQLAARETSNLLKGNGKAAAVLFDIRRIGMQGEVSAFESFKKAVKSNPGVTLAGATVLQPVKLDKEHMGFTVQQLQELARRYAGADLIVCFGGAPFVDIEKLDWDNTRNPRLVSVMSFTAQQLRELFARQLLVLSLAPPVPTPAEVPPATLQEGGLTVQVITPETAAAVLGAPAR